MKAMNDLRAVAREPLAYAKSWKERNAGRVIGYFCSYTPEELIDAAGALPVRLFGFGSDIVRADAHLQTYSCSLVRCALELGLSGSLSFLDGLVFPHTCDSIQRLSDIYRMNTSFAFFEDIVLPVKLDTPSAREYLAALMAAFRVKLETGLGVTISDADLERSVGRYNRIRSQLDELYRIRSRHPGILPGSDLHDVVMASMIMDRRELSDALAAIIDELKGRTAGQQPDPRKRLIISGGICGHPDIYRIIEESNGVAVWDDLCTGSRSFAGTLDTTMRPIDAIAHRYASSRVVCPAKHRSLTDHADALAAMTREHRADGVVFLLLKFCDPHAFDYPHLKERLDREGVPSMLVEIEDALPPEGQLKTRFEAFIESLR